jgi:ribulose-phosphate 3-epimerase
MQPYKILPSILAANIMNLEEDIRTIFAANSHKMLHIDVMDNHYVPNLSFGPIIGAAILEKFPEAELDVHIMANPIDSLINEFASLGVKRLSIHHDSTIHLNRQLNKIKDLGIAAGLALNPATPIDILQWCHTQLDFILVMSVNPGFGGQSFIAATLDKIAMIKKLYPKIKICVDGGIHSNNIKDVFQAGAVEFVIGTGLFRTPSYVQTLDKFHKLLTE